MLFGGLMDFDDFPVGLKNTANWHNSIYCQEATAAPDRYKP